MPPEDRRNDSPDFPIVARFAGIGKRAVSNPPRSPPPQKILGQASARKRFKPDHVFGDKVKKYQTAKKLIWPFGGLMVRND
jgi:hypothetical protein